MKKFFSILLAGSMIVSATPIVNASTVSQSSLTTIEGSVNINPKIDYYELYQKAFDHEYALFGVYPDGHNTILLPEDYTGSRDYRVNIFTSDNATVTSDDGKVEQITHIVFDNEVGDYVDQTYYQIDFSLTDCNESLIWTVVSEDGEMSQNYELAIIISNIAEPKSPIIKVTGDLDKTVSWSELDNGGDPNATYELFVYEWIQDTWINVHSEQIGKYAGKRHFSDLYEGTKYSFVIHVKNAVGSSETKVETISEEQGSNARAEFLNVYRKNDSDEYEFFGQYQNSDMGVGIMLPKEYFGDDFRLVVVPEDENATLISTYYEVQKTTEAVQNLNGEMEEKVAYKVDFTLNDVMNTVICDLVSVSGNHTSEVYVDFWVREEFSIPQKPVITAKPHNEKVSVSWEALDLGGDDFAWIFLHIYELNHDKWEIHQTLRVTDEAQTMLISNLKNETTYRFEIHIQNQVSESMAHIDVTPQELKLDILTTNDMTANDFVDINGNEWYYDAVKFAYDRNLMEGTDGDVFAANSQVTRAMMVQTLYNLAGKPQPPDSNFSDIASTDWYADAVSWAYNVGVVNGIGNNQFNPDGYITREEVLGILYNFSKNLIDLDISNEDNMSFYDKSQVSPWARTAVEWCVGNEIVVGRTNGELDLKSIVTRAEVAQMFMSFINLYL